MAFLQFAPSNKGFGFSLDSEKALRAPIGAASPLWLAFAGAASAGVALWWMSRWMRPGGLEGFLFNGKAAGPAAAAVLPAPEPVVEAVAEVAAAAPAMVETVVEAPVEVAAKLAELVVEAAAEIAPTPETAPAPVAEKPAAKAVAAPKPKSVAAPKPVAKAAPKAVAKPAPAPMPKIMTPAAAAEALVARRNSAAKTTPAKPKSKKPS